MINGLVEVCVVLSAGLKTQKLTAEPVLYNLQALFFLYLLIVSSAAAAQRDCNVIAGNTPAYSAASSQSNYRFDVINRIPHDPSAFTQGLVYFQGKLFESTGLNGQSSVRRLDPKTGRIEQFRQLPDELFGEGLAFWQHRLLQLTWNSGAVFSYQPDDLNQFTQFNYQGEAWGMTALKDRLIVSDGSSILHILDADDLHQITTLQVTESGLSLTGLNELETVDGLIYANIYPTDCISVINPQSGQVTDWVDLRGLMPLSERTQSNAVANGIAYNPQTRHWYVTGKFWSYIFEIKLHRSDLASSHDTDSKQQQIY